MSTEVTALPAPVSVIHEASSQQNIEQVVQNVPDFTICTICRDFENECDFITRCRHEFHETCLSEWIKTRRACPLCNGYITLSRSGEKLLRNMTELGFNDDEVKKYQYFYEDITGTTLCDPNNLQCTVTVPFYDRKFLEKFIELGWDINSPNDGGLTLLSKAAERDDLHRLEILIDLGMELLNENKWGEAAIKTATANKSYIVLDRLNKYKAEVINTSLHAVCANDNFKRVKQLVEEEGADVNARDSLGNRPLHYACSRASLRVVNYLLEKGAVVDCVNLKGRSPIYEACTSIFNRIEIVKRLLQLNPDMKYVDQEKTLFCTSAS